MFDFKDHAVIIALVFVVALGCYTAIEIAGSDGGQVLSDILFALVGGITGVAVQKHVSGGE